MFEFKVREASSSIILELHHDPNECIGLVLAPMTCVSFPQNFKPYEQYCYYFDSSIPYLKCKLVSKLNYIPSFF